MNIIYEKRGEELYERRSWQQFQAYFSELQKLRL